jgi:hypothetical protein
MGMNLSVEITVPDGIDDDAIIAIGKVCAPFDVDADDMDVAEALEWCLSDPGGPQMLAQLGITWSVIQTGHLVRNH